jgi:hypothetical protein
MRRREFIALLSSTATAWPLALRAQQRQRVRRIGILLFDQHDRTVIRPCLQELETLGYVDGKTVAIGPPAGDAGRALSLLLGRQWTGSQSVEPRPCSGDGSGPYTFWKLHAGKFPCHTAQKGNRHGKASPKPG